MNVWTFNWYQKHTHEKNHGQRHGTSCHCNCNKLVRLVSRASQHTSQMQPARRTCNCNQLARISSRGIAEHRTNATSPTSASHCTQPTCRLITLHHKQSAHCASQTICVTCSAPPALATSPQRISHLAHLHCAPAALRALRSTLPWCLVRERSLLLSQGVQERVRAPDDDVKSGLSSESEGS